MDTTNDTANLKMTYQDIREHIRGRKEKKKNPFIDNPPSEQDKNASFLTHHIKKSVKLHPDTYVALTTIMELLDCRRSAAIRFAIKSTVERSQAGENIVFERVPTWFVNTGKGYGKYKKGLGKGPPRGHQFALAHKKRRLIMVYLDYEAMNRIKRVKEKTNATLTAVVERSILEYCEFLLEM